MKILAERHIEIQQSYRVARASGLFNVSMAEGRDFTIEADIPIGEDDPADWRIGVVVGPSGSGKSTVAQELRQLDWIDWEQTEWSEDPIIDAVGGESFEVATAALASVGLGTVPAWLRPYQVLSNGERFRAGLARLLMLPDEPDVFVDEFSSVVDRRVAQIGSMAFAKSWRRRPGGGRVVLLTPHFDVLPWIAPDWILRTSLTGPTVTVADVAKIAPEVIRPTGAPAVARVTA